MICPSLRHKSLLIITSGATHIDGIGSGNEVCQGDDDSVRVPAPRKSQDACGRSNIAGAFGAPCPVRERHATVGSALKTTLCLPQQLDQTRGSRTTLYRPSLKLEANLDQSDSQRCQAH
ncbi:hypothetical protein GJ744_009299 [Endocarpon pusillum]|uniref:Uncharacterized protein n=1 Tax=Endocarpon pusillum TaxID=364733 RepID=A0A8H7AK11_9EURO|nr:hypothetical protein GJ744_009299 [Endocarpon pusillum]